MKSKKTIIVDSAFNGVRLDKFLKEKLDIPFSLLHKELRKKSIKINNKKKHGSYRVKQDDIVDVFKEFKVILENKSSIKIPNTIKRKIKNSVVFQSDHFLIINKWAGIPCQRGSKINLSIDDLLQFLKNKDSHLKLVHRLDKDTTGLLIIAKNSNSARYFHKILSNQKIKKTYYAIVGKKPKNKEGILNDMIPKNKKIVSAITKYQITKKLPGGYFLLKLNPQSGRKHQIRRHCYMNGFPILGDKKYFIERNQIKFSNLFLHAGALEFTDMNNKKVKIETQLPDHFRKYL
tara:strand:+ start:11 stop:880 length:870 start_codon:yes stop_codon:yes gene_type:complete